MAAMCCLRVAVESPLAWRQIVTNVEGTDVLYARPAAVLEIGEERAERPAVGPAGVVVVDGGAQEVLDAVACLASGALDEGGWPTLSWCDNEILAEHRFPFPAQEPADPGLNRS